ncbi:glycosyltransferase family 9 protein [Phenylobacterium aquaticum]|uniref:glycosyltransferase family 9 protein n=1 Tax=Phenylobacterium aquaticum TaxID=1763816 RepID=UPI0026F27BD1|nr:glycosyltransferase family 9 protein [Phenylobacterium aquaticum]
MAREIKKILVIKLSALGDFVLALAAMKQIREAHKKAHITLLTTPPFEALAKSCPYFNAVETDGKPEGFGAWMELRSRLKKARYDRVYDLQTSAASSRIFHLMQPFPPEWSGNALGCALPHRNKQRDHMHTLERQADQLKYAGIWPDAPIEPGQAPPPDVSWVLRKAPQDRPVAGGVRPRPYVIFIPGGSAHRLDKRWPVEKFGELGKLLYARGFDIVIIGGPQESALARQIQRDVSKARDLTGRTDFARVAIIAAKAALVVGNDTGPLHLAAATGAPTIVLFSKASNPALSAPRGHVAILAATELNDLAVSTVAQAANALAHPPGAA